MNQVDINVSHFKKPNAQHFSLKMLLREMVDFRLFYSRAPGTDLTKVKGNEEKTNIDIYTDRKLGSGGLSSWLEKPQHPGRAAWLLYRVGQRGGVTVHRQTRRQSLWHMSGSRRQVQLIQVGVISTGSDLQTINIQVRDLEAMVHMLSTPNKLQGSFYHVVAAFHPQGRRLCYCSTDLKGF